MKSILIIFIGTFIFNIGFAQTNTAVFVYRFTDSSVPPPYHRSYSIDVSESTVHLTIDSYGDILLDETYTILPEQYNDFIKKLIALKLKNKPENIDTHGCSGGTEDSFTIKFPDSKKTMAGSVYHCGGKDYGNLKGKIADAKDLFKSMVPDFAGKMESTSD